MKNWHQFVIKWIFSVGPHSATVPLTVSITTKIITCTTYQTPNIRLKLVNTWN